MATGTMILRPSTDISVEHTFSPTDSTAIYLLLNEEVADGNTTYISSISANSTQERIYSSQFFISGILPSYKIVITKAQLMWNATYSSSQTGDTSSHNLTITNNDISASIPEINLTRKSSGGYVEEFFDFSNSTDFISYLNNYLEANNQSNLPELTLAIQNTVHASGDKTSVTWYLTQIGLVLEYEYEEDMGIHYKSNGAYLPVTQAFHKVNGAWVEISKDECRNLLSG